MSWGRLARMDMPKEIRAEVALWPGVSITSDSSGKHKKLYLEFSGVRRFVVTSSTPGDRHAISQQIRDVRRTLISMGAKKDLATH